MPSAVREALESHVRSAEQTALVADYYRTIAPPTAMAQKKIKELKQKLASLKPSTTVPIMRELPLNKRRKTHIQIRGNYKQKAEEVSGVLLPFILFPRILP